MIGAPIGISGEIQGIILFLDALYCARVHCIYVQCGRLRDFFMDRCVVLCFVILTTTAAVPFPFETFVKKVSKIFQIQFYR